MDMSRTVEGRKCLNPTCPCQDGDPCHYETIGNSKAMAIPKEYIIPGKEYEITLDEYEQNSGR